MPAKGVTTSVGVTAPLPQPTAFGWADPAAPMTAMDVIFPALSGSWPSAFLSRTVLCSATCWASCTCAGVVTPADREPVSGAGKARGRTSR